MFNRKEWSKKYYLDNKDKILKQRKIYYQNNLDSLRKKHREWYYKTKESRRDYCNNYYHTVRKIRIKKLMHDLKINGCAICGYKKCDGSLVFHHTNPKHKKYLVNIDIFNYKDEVIINELNKCILLYANCHGEIHYQNPT